MSQGSGSAGGPEGRGNGAAAGDGRQRIQQFADRASEQAEHARLAFEDLNERVLELVRERPGAALLGAVALGYVVGKIASKLSR
jgi:hypothetical protein